MGSKLLLKQPKMLRLLKHPSSSLRPLSTVICPDEPPIPPPLPPTTIAITANNTNSYSESERELVKLLQSNDDNWNEEQILHLTSSIPPSRVPPIFRRLDNIGKAFKFLQWLQTNSPSILPTSQSIVYQALFENACREKDSHLKLYEILQASKAQNVSLSIDSATILIRHFAQAQMITEMFEVFNDVDPSVKNTHICNTLLDVLCRLGRVVDARKVLDEMLQPESSFPPNALTGSIVFSESVKRDQAGKSIVHGEELVGFLSKLGEHQVFPNAVVLTKLITMLGKSGKTGQAWDLLHVVMKMDCSVEAASVNALLVGLGREHNFEKMNLLLFEMKELGIEPDGITFGVLINHLCRSRRVDEALRVLDNMKKEKENGGLTAIPDLITYNTLIKGLCVVGRQEEGLVLVDSMRSQHGYAPNTITYNALIDGFCKAGEIERSQELYDQMKEEGVVPDVITLNILVNGMCKHGRISSALKFFSDMETKGLKGNAITYTCLISAFCNVNNLDKAMALFDEMVSSRCTPDPIVYYALINGFSRAGRLDDACSVASKMKNAGFFLDAVSYNVLINGFCKKKKLDKVYELLEDMEMTGVRPDEVTYNTLISTLSKSGDFSTVHQWMKKMTDQGLVPTVVTYGALIHGYCNAGKVKEALEIFNLMGRTTKVPPNTVIYNILIDSLCKQKKTEDALSLMKGMKGKGVVPNVVTYNAMLKGLRDTNCLDKAFILMNNMNEQAIYPDYVTMDILTEWLSAAGKIDKLRMFVDGRDVSEPPILSTLFVDGCEVSQPPRLSTLFM